MDLAPRRLLALSVAGLAVGLGGCSGNDKDADGVELPEQSADVLEGFRLGWQGFNHRLSRLVVVAGDEATDVAVIGGTSTSFEAPDLPEGCDQASCNEFPFGDTADVSVWWATARSTAVAMVPVTFTAEVGRDGVAVSETVTLPAEIPGAVAIALVTGVDLDTDHPLAGEASCYRPRYGWHPNHLGIDLGEVELSGTSATVTAQLAFSAGKTFDPDRQCIDEVNERAVVAMTVHAVVLYGDTAIARGAVATAEAYPFSGDKLHPEEQVESAPVTVDFSGVSDPLVGYRMLDFRFDPDRTDDRGAYLRTLGWWVTPEGQANGIATNYSPGTQLEDFGYTFLGEAAAVDVQGTVERGLSSASLAAALDGDGNAVVTAVEH
ncbi:MAG: hypothetical protein R3F59_31745 [Myxococcota bacterium]